MRVLALAKAFYPEIEATKLTGGFPEFNLDGSKFDEKSFQKIDRETCHVATSICNTIRLDSFQPAFDSNGRRIPSEDPEPFLVDVPKIPRERPAADITGSGTPAMPTPSRPEFDDEDFSIGNQLSSICWESKPVTSNIGLAKKKSKKSVQIQEPGKEQGSSAKRAEAASSTPEATSSVAPSMTTLPVDPASAPGPN